MASKLSSWIKAFRLRTLPLALATILMGSFLSVSVSSFNWYVFLLCLLTTIFLQVLSNLANDYGDAQHGADSDQRTGPKRTVQAGEISPKQMKKGIIIAAALSFASGISLLIVAFGLVWLQFTSFFLIGLAAITAAVKYTAGKNPYGYRGLGDIFVFLFFGIVGVYGTFYLHTKVLDWSILLPAASCGLLATGVLNLNNIRDIDSDKAAGKYSIPVRIGRKNAVVYHMLLLILSVVLISVYTGINYESPWQWLFLFTIPILIKNATAVKFKIVASELDPYLRQLAITTLLFVLLYGVGIVL